MQTTSPEQKFLFQLLREKEAAPGVNNLIGEGATSEQEDVPKKVFVPGGEIDFKKLLGLLQRHRLLFLAAGMLKSLPPATRTQWKKSLQQKTLRSHQLMAETLEIIGHFQGAGIRILPLKGAVLAHTLYGDTGARHFNDIDLLVSREDLQKSRELLQQLNYIQQYPENLSGRKWRIYSTYKKDMGFLNREKMTFIELHYGIYVHELLRNKDESRILDNTEHIQIRNKEIQVLDRETTFVYLVYHGCLHQYFRLFWLRDVARCLEIWDLDHGKVLRLTDELGFQRLLGTSLVLAQQYFDIKIPEAYADCLEEDVHIKKMVASCHQRIRNPEHVSFSTKIKKHLYLMRLKPGFSYKWAVLLSIFQRWRIRKFMGGH